MTEVNTRYLVPTFNGLVAQIGFSVGVSVVCVLGFEYNRREKTLEYLYSPRCRLRVDPSPPVSRKFLGWIMPTIRLTEEFYINNVGLDAVMYLRFLWMCFQFCIFNGIIAGAILLPIHYNAGGTLTEVPRLSIANVPRGSNLFWAHVFLTYLITLSWMFLLFKNYWQWMDLRREYTLQRIRQGEIAERSIFISRLPSNLRSDAALRQYFESLKMGPVENATVVQHCGRLSQKIDRRESALNGLERAHIELARSVLDSIQSSRFPAGSIKEAPPTLPPAPPSPSSTVSDKVLAKAKSGIIESTTTKIKSEKATAAVDYATLQQMAQELFKGKKQYNKYRKSVFATRHQQAIAGSHFQHLNPSSDFADASLSTNARTAVKQTLEASEAMPHQSHDTTIDMEVYQQPEQIKALADRTESRMHALTVWDLLGAVRRQALGPYQPTRPEKRFKGGNRVDSIDYFVKKYNRLDKKVEELRDGSLRYKSTSFGFVTFKHHLSAQLCAQSKIDSRPQGLSVRLAMEPRDVLWSNLTISFRNRFTRSIAVNLSLWTLIVFWIFPTSSFLLLTSLGQLSSRFSFLKPILEASPLIQSLLQNVLPIVFVTIFLALAPVIILAISKQELPVSHSELEGKVLRRYYHFLIFNVLFVFVIGSAILKSIISIIQKPTNIFTLLAEYLPAGSTFFVFYIVFNTCTHFLELVQIWAQLIIHLFATARKLTSTPRSLQRAITPWSFQYYYYYPQNILAFVITLIYSIISPLILLAAIFFFGFALLIFKYQLAYSYLRKYENSGRYFRHVFQYTSDGLIIFHVTMIGVLWLNEAVVGGFFIVALLGFTVYFKIMCADLFRSRTKFLPLDTGLRNFDQPHEPEDIGEEDRDEEEEGKGRSSVVSGATTSSKRSAHIISSSGLRSRRQTPSPKRVVESFVQAATTTVNHHVSSGASELTSRRESSAGQTGSTTTFSRLCANAGQSDRYKKLVHRDSDGDIQDEKEQAKQIASGSTKQEMVMDKDQDKVILSTEQGQMDLGTDDGDMHIPKPIEPHQEDTARSAGNVIIRDGFAVEDLPATGVVAAQSHGHGPDQAAATYGDGFLADNSYFANAKPFGPTHFLHETPLSAAHFDHSPSRIVYQDQTSEFETYIHPALLKPLNRKLWLPRNPLFEHWDLDDTVEIDFVITSSALMDKVKFRVQGESQQQQEVWEGEATSSIESCADDDESRNDTGEPYATQSPKAELSREMPHRRNTGGTHSSFDSTHAGVSTANWEGCLTDGAPETAYSKSDLAYRRRETGKASRSAPGVLGHSEVLRGRNHWTDNGIQKSPPHSPRSSPLYDPASMAVADAFVSTNELLLQPQPQYHGARPMSMPLEAMSSSHPPQRPNVTPLVSPGISRRPLPQSRKKSGPIRAMSAALLSHGGASAGEGVHVNMDPNIAMHMPLSTRSATFAAPSALIHRHSTFCPSGSGYHSHHYHQQLHQHHHHPLSSSGIGAGTTSSIHKTEPKNARGFLNMIIGRLDVDDPDDDGTKGDGRALEGNAEKDKPTFGYETGSVWMGRRQSLDRYDDDDDDDENVSNADDLKEKKEDEQVAKEERREDRKDKDVKENKEPGATSAQSGSLVQRTMNLLRDAAAGSTE
ncbi:hypothetical protein EDD11_000948 [Mortierella claussenii]|nr:hypothetical protein EDD11_000948 [Mortierella claussenii]